MRPRHVQRIIKPRRWESPWIINRGDGRIDKNRRGESQAYLAAHLQKSADQSQGIHNGDLR